MEKRWSVWLYDSHPMDSRIMEVGVFPTVNAKAAKLCADGALVLIRTDE